MIELCHHKKLLTILLSSLLILGMLLGLTGSSVNTAFAQDEEPAAGEEATQTPEPTLPTEPSDEPTEEITEQPPQAPTEEPTEPPTEEPMDLPTEEPLQTPTPEPFEEIPMPPDEFSAQGEFLTQSTGVTTRVSVDSGGAQAEDDSYRPSISADGRYVAFTSYASNLVSGDTNGAADVFVHDRQTGQTTLVSVDSEGAQGNGESCCTSISADGRYVAFWSYASNLVSGDTNGAADVFVHDRQTGETTRVSVDSEGAQGNEDSHYTPSISADGRYVAFWSSASNLVSGDTNGDGDVFVHDRQTGTTTRVSVDSDGAQANYSCQYPSISADGCYVAFGSSASNLVSDDTNWLTDIFVHDRVTGVTTRVSVDSGGVQGNDDSRYSSISSDGRYVAFISIANNLVSGDTNGAEDIFVHDRQTDETTRVSVASDGSQGNDRSDNPSISADGRYVAFSSFASNLVSGDTNSLGDIFVHDRQTGETTRVSVDNDGAQANGYSYYLSISADGHYVAFQSSASNLVSGDTNETADIFVHDCFGKSLYVTVNQSDQQADPTNKVPINFTAKFSKPVTGFDENDIDFTGSTVSGELLATVSGSGDTYTISVSGMTSGGLVVVSIPAGSAIDDMGTQNYRSTSIDNSIYYILGENPLPAQLTRITDSFGNTWLRGEYGWSCQPEPACWDPALQIGDMVTFTASAEDPNGLPLKFKFTAGNATQDWSSDNTYVWHVDLEDVGPNKIVWIFVRNNDGQDWLGEWAGGDDYKTISYTVYNIAPLTVTINQSLGQSDPTSTSPINFTAAFNRPIDIVSFETTDVTVSGSAYAKNVVITEVEPFNSTKFNIAVSGMTRGGTVSAFIPQDRVFGQNGSKNSASTSTDNTVTFIDSIFYRSSATQDGWVLESARFSNKGGSLNKTAATFSVGDDAKNRQYRSILHFNTATLPDNAVITAVKLQVRRFTYVGTYPFNTHGALYVDLRKGAFSNNAALQLADWQAPASKLAAGRIPKTSTSSWHTLTLAAANFGYINKSGVTQVRLRFAKQDNGDNGADYITFYSGNSAAANRPKLTITYYVP